MDRLVFTATPCPYDTTDVPATAAISCQQDPFCHSEADDASMHFLTFAPTLGPFGVTPGPAHRLTPAYREQEEPSCLSELLPLYLQALQTR